MPIILLVGAADTGRAPIAAALLRRMASERGHDWQIGSAGVLGHDDDPPEAEARTAMVHMSVNIDAHRARSVSNELVDAATLIIAIDSGTAKALAARFPAAKTHSLGALAGTGRDIPDPFRMQVGAWMTYARELETLLAASLEQITGLVQPKAGGQGSGVKDQEPQTETQNLTRKPQTATLSPLLAILVAMPEVLNWTAAKQRLEAELMQMLVPMAANDVDLAYAGLLRAALALSANPPTAQQVLALQAAFMRLEQPIQPADLTALSAQLGGWQQLLTAGERP